MPLAVTLALAAGCARVAPPGGGPEDETPATVISTSPADGAVEVARDTEITIELSEEMTRSSAERAFSIAPSPGTVRFRWSGPAVTAGFDSPLPDSTTFVVTLSPGALDYHGVATTDPFRFAFSTGRVLDAAVIAGTVRSGGEAAADAVVWACARSARTDSLGRIGPCEYSSRTGDDGSFLIVHVRAAEDPYTLVAFLDEDGDGLYDVKTEPGAIAEAAALVAAPDDSVGGLSLSLGAAPEAGEESR